MTTNKNTISIHPLSGYSFIEREAQPEEDHSVTARLKRLEEQYEESGIRRSVEAIMVVEVHGFPHILVLQVANAFYKLPGGYLDPSESDSTGLITRLNEQLGVPFIPTHTYPPKPLSAWTAPNGKETEPNKDQSAESVTVVGPGGSKKDNLWILPLGGKDWHLSDCLSVWWRPNFDTFYYPYVPAHISQPKECKKLYLVDLPPNKTFAVPANMKLHAIPIYEFYDNAARYGPQFAGIPYVLSKYEFIKSAELQDGDKSGSGAK